jgi:hypothetical protein
MVKNVLIGKNDGRSELRCGGEGRFVGSWFILNEGRGVMVNRAFPICAYDPEMRAGTGASARRVNPILSRAAVDMARGQRRRWRFSARCFGSKRGARRRVAEGVAVGEAEGALGITSS